MACSAPRSTALTKSNSDFCSHWILSLFAAPCRMISAARAAAATHVARSSRLVLFCPDVTDLQWNTTVRRAARRQLPRRGEELGAAAARVRLDHLRRRLSRDHGEV